jgi:ubiquinone biosynthesis protein COQ9
LKIGKVIIWRLFFFPSSARELADFATKKQKKISLCQVQPHAEEIEKRDR